MFRSGLRRGADMLRRGIRVAFLIGVGLIFALGLAVPSGELDPKVEAAVVLYREEGPERALPEFERLAAEFKRSGDRRDEAAALHYVGECHWRLGDFEKARGFLDRALTLERNARDRHAEGKTLNVLGLLEWDLGNYTDAQRAFRSANSIGLEVGDRKLEGSSLNNLSLVYDELGDYDTSLKQYKQVLEIYRDADFPRGMGDTLGNIGGVHLLLGQFREGLGYYEQALAISERLKSKPSMSQDHGNIALCLLGLGDVEGAASHFDSAIALAREAGMRQDEAYWLGQKGNGLIQQGRYDQGLKLHRAALAAYEEIGAQAELAAALHDVGRLHLLLGDPDSAERYFDRALDLSRKIELSRGVTQNLIALGDLDFRRERLDAAASLYGEARKRAVESEERHFAGQSLLRLAQVHRQQEQLARAEAEIAEALSIAHDIGARSMEAEAGLARAELDRQRSRLDTALKSYDAAQALLASIGDPDLLWQIHYGRGLTYEARGDIKAAIKALTAAVSVIESVRDRLEEQRFRSGYVQDKYEVYTELVRLQLKQGATAEAFSTAERLRARSYAEQLGGRSPAVLSEGDQRREAELRERIRQLQRAISEEENPDRPGGRQLALGRFSSELLAAEREYQAFIDDRAGGLSGEGGPDAIPTAARVQARLANDEALIEYVVARDHLMSFVVSRRAVSAHTAPLPRRELSAKIGLLRDLIQRPGDDRWRKPAASLAASLIQPLEREGLLEGVRHLYLVPHGTLNYLPFALLPMGGQATGNALIHRYTLAQLPAAGALLRSEQATEGPSSLLAVAPARSRLRYAPQEARAIDALYRPNSRLLVGNTATESRFKKLAGDFRILHLATHGHFNKLNPLLSGLELESDAIDDGLLQVHEVLRLRLTAQLVTLSACETALGSGYLADVPAGDEFVGMTRAFLAAGSTSVMATLWDVDDAASVRLMQRFYKHLNNSSGDTSKARALANAQREFQSSARLTHPYYWAPFVLVGTEPRSGKPAERLAGSST